MLIKNDYIVWLDKKPDQKVHDQKRMRTIIQK